MIPPPPRRCRRHPAALAGLSRQRRRRPPTADDPRLPGFGIEFLEGSRKNYDLFERYVEETTREQLAEAENSDSKEGQG